MNKVPSLFLQLIVALLALVSLILMLWEPLLEGRNAHATLYQVYFNDPFLAYAYTASIPLYVALYQAFKLLGKLRQNKPSPSEALKSLRIIKYCALSLLASVGAAEAWLFIAMRGKDDIAGGVAIGLLLMILFGLAAITATVFEKRLPK